MNVCFLEMLWQLRNNSYNYIKLYKRKKKKKTIATLMQFSVLFWLIPRSTEKKIFDSFFKSQIDNVDSELQSGAMKC